MSVITCFSPVSHLVYFSLVLFFIRLYCVVSLCYSIVFVFIILEALLKLTFSCNSLFGSTFGSYSNWHTRFFFVNLVVGSQPISI